VPVEPQRENHSSAARAGARRPSTLRVRLIAPAVAALLGAGCAGAGEGSVAEVTLPELDTTTTTSVVVAPDRTGEEPPTAAWTLQLGGPGDDVLRAVSGDGDTVGVVGSTTGPIEGSAAVSGGNDVLVAVSTTSGELLTLRTAGSEGADVANGVATAAEGAIACGSTSGTLGSALGGSIDLWCALVEPGEDPLPSVSQLGGAESQEIIGVGAAPDQSFAYAGGRVVGFLPGAQDPTGRGLGGGDALVVQLAVDGSPVWARQFGTPNDDGALGVTMTADGDGVLVGFTDGDLGRASSGGRDAWISRFDPSGLQRWVSQIGSAGDDTMVAVDVAGRASQGTLRFIGVGHTDGGLGSDGVGRSRPAGTGAEPVLDGFVAAFGPDGMLAWTSALGSEGEDRATAVVVDGATIYVAGTTVGGGLGELDPQLGPGGGADGFLAALDTTSGEVVWVTRFGSAGDEEISSMTATEDGMLVIAGSTTGQMTEEPPRGGKDGFLVAFPLPTAGGGAASAA
jgi:hypothetical protein